MVIQMSSRIEYNLNVKELINIQGVFLVFYMCFLPFHSPSSWSVIYSFSPFWKQKPSWLLPVVLMKNTPSYCAAPPNFRLQPCG